MPNQPKGNQATIAGVAGGLATGAILQNFRIDRQLGRGGMGEVWKAYDTVGEREVVIKVLPPELQGNQVELTRIKETFKKIHALQHQHICPTHALGNEPAVGYFLVMKFLDGIELKEHARRSGDMNVEQVVKLLKPVASALDYAHSQGIVHRDVKTENIMVSREGENPQLVDFGVASDIRASLARVSNVKMEISGTRPYMAPEQWKGEFQDGRVDQYALGVVTYELLAGRLPFSADDPTVLRQCVLNDPAPTIAGQSVYINAILQRALAKHRDARYGSCTEFIESLSKQPAGGAAVPALTPEMLAASRRKFAGGPQPTAPTPSKTAVAPPPTVARRKSAFDSIREWQYACEKKVGVTPANRWKLWGSIGAVLLLLALLLLATMLGMFEGDDSVIW